MSQSPPRAMAIAEWPTKSGPADYALFVGTSCIGVVEAKRRNKNVSAHIDQAQRYARDGTFGAKQYVGKFRRIGFDGRLLEKACRGAGFETAQ